MLGTREAPQLKLKAMQTYGLALYLQEAMHKHADRLGSEAPLLQEMGDALLRFRDLLSSSGPTLPDDVLQAALDLWKRVMRLSTLLAVDYGKKTHLMAHCIRRAKKLGNPVVYQTFEDESLNATLKKVLRFCHQNRFEQLAMAKMNQVLRRRAVRPRLA
eukprot:14570352-Alexandrium_andersonii.AAC.1